MKFPISIIVIMLFLSPVIIADYSGVSGSTINSLDATVIAESTGED